MAGVLRVTLPVSSSAWVSEAMAQFGQATTRTPRWLRGFRLDLRLGAAVGNRGAHNTTTFPCRRSRPLGTSSTSSFHFGHRAPETSHPSRKLAELPRSFFATPAYLAERGTPSTYAELAGHDLIQHQYQVRDKVFPLIEGTDGTSLPPTARAVVNHAVLVRELVLGDLGIGLMPDILCRQDVAEGQLVRIPLDWQSPPLSASATYLARRYAPAKMRAFLDSIAAYLQSHA